MPTQESAVTRFIEADNGVKYAYRRLHGLVGSAFVNPLAQARPINIFDNAGAVESTGSIPDTFTKWADNMVALIVALQIPSIDVLDFSFGGCVAQMAALNYPTHVRKVILAGTVASANADSPPTDWDLVDIAAETEEEVKAALAESFFTHNQVGTAKFQAYWTRLSERNGKAPIALDHARTEDQTRVWTEWTKAIPSNSATRLTDLIMSVFVATGDTDILVPTASSFELTQKIPFSHFHVYPNAGHGFYGQHGATFASHANTFLDFKENVLLGKKIFADV
ncbi:hypothetical protein MMC18_007565 [Xylographa bjoerkii]|nr:hypothetical protein [Xylographa bjoerkii]